MNNKKILGFGVGHLVIVGILIIFGGTAFFAQHKLPSKGTGIYCSSDGTLTNKMPIQSHRSYCLKSHQESRTFSSTDLNQYSFNIVTDEGNSVKDFAITHTKRMHVIVVRKDLAYFQHVHPEFNEETGTFTLNELAFQADGDYRVFADFSPVGAMLGSMGTPLTVTISEDIKVGNKYSKQAFGLEEGKKTFDGVEFTFASSPAPLVAGQESMLTFKLRSDDQPVTDLESYLGALGHSVVLKEGSLEFIHAHPMERKTSAGTIEFIVDFPEAGRYKVFTQFQRAGKVITTDFVVSVVEGSGMPTNSSMEHEM